MKTVVVAPFTKHADKLLYAFRQLHFEKIIFLTDYKNTAKAKKFMEENEIIKKFGINVEIEEINKNILTEIFAKMLSIKQREKDSNIIVNCACSSGIESCLTMAATFVNGLKAFTVVNNSVKFMPLLKFDYNLMISDKKAKILSYLIQNNGYSNLAELGRTLKMSEPLISYHIYGTDKKIGLMELGLVELKRNRCQVEIKPTDMAKLVSCLDYDNCKSFLNFKEETKE